MKIFIRDFTDPFARYSLDVPKLIISRESNTDLNEAQIKCQGQGCYLKIGLFQRNREFFAIYQNDDCIFIYAAGKLLNLETEIEQMHRVTCIPFLRKFTLTSKDQRKKSWIYWPVDWIEDEPYTKDFFWYMERVAGSLEERNNFMLYWNHTSNQGTADAKPDKK